MCTMCAEDGVDASSVSFDVRFSSFDATMSHVQSNNVRKMNIRLYCTHSCTRLPLMESEFSGEDLAKPIISCGFRRECTHDDQSTLGALDMHQTRKGKCKIILIN